MDVKVADRIRHCQTSSTDNFSEPPVDLPPMALPDKEQLTREWTETAATYIIPHMVSSSKRAWEAEDSMKIEEFFQENGEVPQEEEN